jgi:hypothetical protein
MAQYLLSVYYPEGAVKPPPEELAQIGSDVQAIHEQLQAEGVWVFGGGLHDPDTSTVVQMRNGQVLTTDGPFAETKEQLGGFSIVDVPDRDTALTWAARLAGATKCPIEVRPFQDEPGA